MADLPYEISASQVKSRLEAGEQLVLLDVREPGEHQTCRIGGALLIPINTVPQRLQDLEALANSSLIVVY